MDTQYIKSLTIKTGARVPDKKDRLKEDILLIRSVRAPKVSGLECHAGSTVAIIVSKLTVMDMPKVSLLSFSSVTLLTLLFSVDAHPPCCP